jgi:hypothetical protein
MRSAAVVVLGVVSATAAIAGEVQGYECLRLVSDQQIKCGPWQDNKPQFAFENVPDLYAKGYRVVAAYFVPEHRAVPGSSSVNNPNYRFIIEKR